MPEYATTGDNFFTIDAQSETSALAELDSVVNDIDDLLRNHHPTVSLNMDTDGGGYHVEESS